VEPESAEQWPRHCGAERFASTHWSVVLKAGRANDSQARDALTELCRVYWRPLHAFVRRRGHSAADAQDLTQEFFCRLLRPHYLAHVDPARGRFRSFLLGAVKHFLANERDKVKTQKRGGGLPLIPLDTALLEAESGGELANQLTPEEVYDRRWATTLLNQVLQRLEAENRASGKGRLFALLRDYLTLEENHRPYAETAKALGTTEGAVKVGVHRLRQRYRAILREEVGATLADPRQVDEELRDLFAAFNA
jgi:RNA polymerase sigma-70 factor (ECF subfamily)